MNSSYLFLDSSLYCDTLPITSLQSSGNVLCDYAVFAYDFPEVSHLFFILTVFPNFSSPPSPPPIQHYIWFNNDLDDSLWLGFCAQSKTLHPVIDSDFSYRESSSCTGPLFTDHFSLCLFTYHNPPKANIKDE